jgi:hypothetical protein
MRVYRGTRCSAVRRQANLSAEDVVALVVNGFVKDGCSSPPVEFAVEAQKLIYEVASNDVSTIGQGLSCLRQETPLCLASATAWPSPDYARG